MRKKNLSVKVAALAMSGTLAMAPMTVRAAGATETTATESTEITETAAPAATPAAENSATVSGTPAPANSGATPAAPVTVSESAADPATTVPNNVNDVVKKDEYQGTKIKANGVSCEITTDDVKDKTVLYKKSSAFNGTEYENKESGDLVMKGDLSIKEEEEE